MMDVKIDCSEGKFKFRVCGILKVNDKYLTVKIQDNDFYCLPGGHVELGEDTDSAVLREMKEELGYDVKIDRLVSIIQNFFKAKDGRTFHELGYYYIVEPKNIEDVNLEDYVVTENDKGKLVPVRIGEAPKQGKGIEYEFDMLMQLSQEHNAMVIKDRTGKYQDVCIEMPDEKFGADLAEWLNEGETMEKYDMVAIGKKIASLNTIEELTDYYMSFSSMSDDIRTLFTGRKQVILKKGE